MPVLAPQMKPGTTIEPAVPPSLPCAVLWPLSNTDAIIGSMAAAVRGFIAWWVAGAGAYTTSPDARVTPATMRGSVYSPPWPIAAMPAASCIGVTVMP